MEIDLNADLGEGMDCDDAILDCVTSANIACGGHAGDAASMRTAVRAALARGVALGAHPGYPDREGFGRRDMALPPAEVTELVRAQVRALADIAAAEGARLVHVKPHGALYNQAARDVALAEAVVAGIAAVDPTLTVVGLAGGALTRAARAHGMPAAEEAFADRAYLDDGALAPRGLAGAVLDDPQQALAQAVRMLTDGAVTALSGHEVALRADTLCLHGDGAHALALARRLRGELEARGVAVRALPLRGR
jgi:UPF0271 protein